MVNRKQALRKAHSIEDAIRQILLHEWDPIGIADVPEAADEYNMYIGGIYGLLASKADVARVAQHLAAIQTDRMGLPADPADVMHVARRLTALDVSVKARQTP